MKEKFIQLVKLLRYEEDNEGAFGYFSEEADIARGETCKFLRENEIPQNLQTLANIVQGYRAMSAEKLCNLIVESSEILKS